MTDSNILEVFGKNLEQQRKKKSFSQSTLAALTGFDQTYISLLERGDRNPTLETIKSLSIALKCNISELVE